jgi:transglutaminase-like putative cysteine protease
MPAERTAHRWLLATVFVTLAPHAAHLPGWLAALCLTLLALRGAQLWAKARLCVPRALLLLLAVGLAAAIRVQFGHFFGKDPGVAFLAALLCLKLLEGQTTRDLRVAVLLSFFLQMGLFFYNQTMAVAALALAGTWLAIVTLLAVHHPHAQAAHQLRSGGLLLTQAVPFMLVLFVLFPRIPGPLWGLPADAHSGVTGLSDTMAPGSISELSLSDEIAFRAEFTGMPPPPALRYWRGPVLTEFDGFTWHAARSAPRTEPAYAPDGPVYDYLLTLEPHNRHWVLALDYPDAGLADIRYTGDFRLLATRPVRSRTHFALSARPATVVGLTESQDTLTGALRLPASGNPRTRALAAELAIRGGDARGTVQQAIAHLRTGGYIYTLSPALLSGDTIDGFLFDTREGFCEHFASAFVFLMRAAGVPARVVTGYQGGAINPVDGVMVVRQSDAHAWAEVWLAGEGWRRVDPTALAAPRRIEAGLGESLRQGDPRPLLMRAEFSWLRNVRHQWEALSNRWNQWVLGYNQDRQRGLLERLGFARADWRTLTVAMSAAAALLMACLIGWALLQRRRLDALDRAWLAFCGKAARRGLARHAWEGPLAFAARLGAAFPAQAAEIDDIAQTYARLRYRAPGTPADIRALNQRIRRLQLSCPQPPADC